MVAAIAFFNRDKPAWRKDLAGIYVIALGQVTLGVVTWVLLNQ
jgi:hypothetical protein